MKKEKLYDFPIDHPLTPARRKTVEKHVKQNARLFPQPVSYGWDEDDDKILHIVAQPVQIEVRFREKSVELYGAAPLWARLLFTKQKKVVLREQIESILYLAKFVDARRPKVRASKTRSSSAIKRRKKSAV